ncbi:hypothetical protein R6Q59_035032 [Mikania micrantha]
MAWPCGPGAAPFLGQAAYGRPIAWHDDTGSCAPRPPCGSLFPEVASLLGGVGKVSIDFGLLGAKEKVGSWHICGPGSAPWPGHAAHGRPIEWHADLGSGTPQNACGWLILDNGGPMAPWPGHAARG